MIWIIMVTVIFTCFLLLTKKRNAKLSQVTTTKRGTRTERNLVLKLLRQEIPARTIFHDLYVKRTNGTFAQIDLVVATKVGILVFEVKEFSGWIFGKGYQSQWTQVLAYGNQKYRFYNPVMQNNKHIEDLKKQLSQFKRIPFYSIVVFYGDCVLKDVSFIPDGIFLVKPKRVMQVIQMIMSNNNPAPYTDKAEVLQLVTEAVKNGESEQIQKQHIENIRNMLGTDRIFD